jgi:hypothetical protein
MRNVVDAVLGVIRDHAASGQYGGPRACQARGRHGSSARAVEATVAR